MSDRRRINGPEESFHPVFDDAQPSKVAVSRVGRAPEAIRPIFLQPGLISQANGSAYIEAEKTKLTCAIYGPRQTKSSSYSEKGRLNVDVKFAPFSCQRRRAPLRDAEDRSVSVAIYQALVSSIRLELLPKSTVDVYIVILESDGVEGSVACGTIAASVALADAGIDMFALVASCAACVINGQVWLDPTEEESRTSNGSHRPIFVWQSGRMSSDQVIACTSACQERCKDVHSVIAQALLENTNT